MENTTYLIKNIKVSAIDSFMPDVNSNTVNKTVKPMTWEKLNETLEYMFTEFMKVNSIFGYKKVVMTFEYVTNDAPEHIKAVDRGFDPEGDIYCC